MNNLRKLRLNHAMSQADVGKLLEVQNTAISMYEREERSLDDKTIRKLCKIFGCSADYLLGLSDYTSPVISPEDNTILAAYHAASEKERRTINGILSEYIPEGPDKDDKNERFENSCEAKKSGDVADNQEEGVLMQNTDILRDVHAEAYGFKIVDLMVAILIKAYLQLLKPEVAKEQLSRIISPGVKTLYGSTVKKRGLLPEDWSAINGKALAELIDDARTAAAISAMEWKAQEGEQALEHAIELMRDNLFPILSGEKYVETIPVEMAEFLTDCWLMVA